MKIIAVCLTLGLGLALWLTVPLAAEAALCRTTAEHTICILDIKRSAKNYWEYRAVVKVDREERPLELYNCRDRVRVRADGVTVPFVAHGAGDVICRTLNHGESRSIL
jgi:hypothetical protein